MVVFFRLRIFNRNMVVVCDRSMIEEFSKWKEEMHECTQLLKQLYFADAFSEDADSLDQIIGIVRKTVGVRFTEFIEKIHDEANRMVSRLRSKIDANPNVELDLAPEMIRFVACTSARCFIDIQLDEETYDASIKFANLVNRIVVLTYFFPRRVLHFVFNPILRRYRLRMLKSFLPQIQKYRRRSHIENINDSSCFC